MNYLHYDFTLRTGDVVEVTLYRQANVRLLDSVNYSRYQKGAKHSYHGGLAKTSPVRIPCEGNVPLAVEVERRLVCPVYAASCACATCFSSSAS